MWLGTWAKRLKLTIDSSKVDTANLTDFPVMVYLSAASGIGDVDVSAFFDELGSDANRKKVAFTTSDGTTQIYAEIEKFDYSSEKAWYHAKVPTVTYDSDPYIYLYYDSAQADNITYIGDTTDAVTHNVWDSNFVAVYHMAQDPSGGAGCIIDSTTNANDGTPAGSMTTADLVSGKTGDAIDFDGIDDYINVSESTDFDFGTGDYTTEAIFKSNSLTNYARLISLGYPKCIPLRFKDNDIGTYLNSDAFYISGANLNDDVFHHVCISADRDGNAVIYNNGGVYGSSDISGKSGFDIDVDGLGIAADPGGGDYLYACIDEVRISNIARSASWIKATYNSLWDSLITFGAEELDPNVYVSTTTATLTVTPNAATVFALTVINATYVALTVTPQNADVNLNVSFTAASVPVIITPKNATVVVDVINVWGISQSLIITPESATISYDISVTATSQALTITPYNATVWDGAAWSIWISQNWRKVVKRYYCVLTGDADGVDDLTLPMSSFQARRKSGAPTYLSVVIPTITNLAEIALRPNGEIRVDIEYVIGGVSQYREVLCTVDYETVRMYQGGRNQSIIIEGHKTESFTPKTIEIQDVIYYGINNGYRTFRCASADLYLSPGDTAVYDGIEVVANSITYSIAVSQSSMQISESD